MNDLEYQLNELHRELTGKICTTMNSDAVESMREAYQSNLRGKEDLISDLKNDILSKLNDLLYDAFKDDKAMYKRANGIEDNLFTYVRDLKC